MIVLSFWADTHHDFSLVVGRIIIIEEIKIKKIQRREIFNFS
jgi:hypothetical protein